MRFFIAAAVLVSAGFSADFTTYIGDSNQYQATALALDSAGNSYITGSRVIPLGPDVSASDVFVTKVDAKGSIVFTTTFGGKGTD